MEDDRSPAPVSGYWRLLEDIFHEALDRPEATRAAFIEQRCGGDRAMEREVHEILSAFEAQDRISAPPAHAPLEGARFGAFELVRQIGEGGMGAVYLARRCGDFEQRAAIKLIGGTPAAAVLMADRFRQERQILASLEHPNIARLLDGGLSSKGQPYLAMEYVEGIRLDEYCGQRNLSIPQRLELFRKICAAVGFAHQRLVVHRDLKPGNILVDASGEPKLLDFGIAKVLDSADGAPEQTLTRAMGVAMTPRYASPEQIQGFSCTTASDIYSLGVILYELLAGKGPYGDTPSTFAEIVAAVVTKDVPRPSVAAPEILRPRLRGDLDGIVLKALAKRAEDRYGSAERLSEDIRRHLEGLPVSAVEGTRRYVAWKFVRRHRVGVAGAALVLVSLLAGLAGTLWQARAAMRERALAEQRFSDARKLANYLLFPLFDAVGPLAGSLPVRADMANQSLQYLDRLSAAKSTDRALRLELAEGYLRLGTILWAPSGFGDSLGNSAQAIQVDRKALALLQPLDQEAPGNDNVRRDLARAWLQLGPAQNVQSQPKQAIATLQQAVAIYEKLAAAKPSEASRQVDAGRAWQTLMDVAASPGGGFLDSSGAGEVMTDGNHANEHFQAALALSPSESAAGEGIIGVYVTQGWLSASIDPPKGLALIARAREAFNRLPESERKSPAGLVSEAGLDSAAGWAEQRMGQLPEALKSLKRAAEVWDAVAAVDPKNASNATRRGNLAVTLAQIHLKLKMYPEAFADYQQAIAIFGALADADPNKTSSRMIRATCEAYVSRFLLARGDRAQAEKYARDGITDLKTLADRPGATAQYLREASIALMVTPILPLRDYPLALRYALRADELSEGKEPTAIAYLAMAYANNGQADKALQTVERGLAIVPPPAPGQGASDERQNLENEQRDIRILIRTGKLPADFNQ